MDFLRNVSVSSEFQAPSASLDDLFPTQNTEVDVSLEWLSIFVEDCFSSRGNCIPPVSNVEYKAKTTTTITTTETTKPTNSTTSAMKPSHEITPPSLQKFVVPCKARSKRKRVSTTSSTKHNPFSTWSCNLQLTNSDPLLLQQSCWLADSELIVPKKEDNSNTSEFVEEEKAAAVVVEGDGGDHHHHHQQQQQQPRRCSHCLSQRTPQWRAGPLGPKTLCNACGVRYKSGRLLPEYRPAKSPSFVSYLHSNSHKKVMEMRTSLLSSIPSEQ